MALTAELAEKQAEKLKSLGVTEVCAWVAEVSGIAQDGPMAEWLQSGVVLCELANALQPGAVSKINRQGKMMFKQLENISAFIRATKALGVSATFETNDLYEQNNLVLVVQCLQALKDQTTARGGAGAGLAKLGAATPPTRGAKMPVPVVPTAGGAERAAPRPTAELEGVAADGYSQAEGAEGGRGGWGINADLEAKKKEEYAKLPEAEIVAWVGATAGGGAPAAPGPEALAEWLRDGQILCALANALQPGAVPKVDVKTKFKQMENVSAFLKVAKHQIGVTITFETVDLYDERDMLLVLRTLDALKSKCEGVSAGRGSGGGDALRKLGAGADALPGAKVPVQRMDQSTPAVRTTGSSASVAGVAHDGYSQAEGVDGGRGGWGLSAAIEQKKAEQYAKLPESDVVEWVSSKAGGSWLKPSAPGPEALAEWLRDGQVLCALANALEPGAYAVKPTKLPFKQMENISAFCRWAKAHGVPGGFETVDLFEAKDMVLVLQTLLNLGIKAGDISKGA